MNYRIFEKEEYPGLLDRSLGCAVPEPWGSVVENMLHKLMTVRESGIDVSVRQIKEKFGSLRVYVETNQNADLVDQIVYDAVLAGSTICASCGSTEDVKLGTTSNSRWVLPLCGDCREGNVVALS